MQIAITSVKIDTKFWIAGYKPLILQKVDQYPNESTATTRGYSCDIRHFEFITQTWNQRNKALAGKICNGEWKREKALMCRA